MVWHLVLKVCILVLLGIIGVFGNGLVIISFLRNNRLQKTSNVFLFNLAVCDLLVSVINIPLSGLNMVIQRWQFPHALCVAYGYISIVLFISSVSAMTVLTYHRYISVARWSVAYRIFSTRRIKISIALAWGISFTLAAPPLLGWGVYRYIPGAWHCFVDWNASISYSIVMTSCCFLVPLGVVIRSYYGIFAARIKSQRQVEIYEIRTLRRRQEHKMTLMVLAILLVFVICWLPYVVAVYLDMIWGAETSEAKAIGLIFGEANPAADFFIYIVMNQSIMEDIKKIFRGSTTNNSTSVQVREVRQSGTDEQAM